jgi:hypothetical protein
MDPNQSIDLFIRSQGLLLPDDLDGESSSRYTPGSALRDDTPGAASRRSNMSLNEGWRSRLVSLKERGFERMESMRDRMTGRVSSMNDTATSRVSTMRDGVTERVHGMGRELRQHPVKWAGMAAGAGIGMGLAGRMMMRMRARSRRPMPSLVIIETC